jgi:signal recognition particle subunit SRP72
MLFVTQPIERSTETWKMFKPHMLIIIQSVNYDAARPVPTGDFQFSETRRTIRQNPVLTREEFVMSLVDLFKQLGAHSQHDEHEKVLDYADRILKSQPGDKRAALAKVVALINLDRYGPALQIFESHHELKNTNVVEYAYCLYKEDKLKDLQGLDSHHRGVKHALAQTYYRHDEYSKARELYTELSNDMSDRAADEEYDISVNRTAVDASVGNEVAPDTRSYDKLFNAASACIQRKQWESALELLRDAKMACERSLSESEAIDEKIPILIQAAYVNIELGRQSEAQSILDSIGVDSIQDAVLRHIVVNNQIVMKPDTHNPQNDIARLDASGDQNKLDARETRYQQQILKGNKLLLQHSAGRSLSRLAANYVKQFPGAVNFGILRAIGNAVSDEELAQQVHAHYRKNPDNISYALAAAQLWIDSGNRAAAKQALSGLIASGKCTAPGLVGALIALLRGSSSARDFGKRESYVDVLSEAFKNWDVIGNVRFVYPAALLAESDDDHVREQALAFFRSLFDADSDSAVAIAGLAAAGDAGADRSKLPSIQTLIADVDVHNLEYSGVMPLLAKRTVGTDVSGPSKKRKRSGKPRLPKEYDSGKKPDLERWLPKRDRSTWKPKRKDKKKMTQGGGADNITESVVQSLPASTVKTSSSKSNKKKKKGKK